MEAIIEQRTGDWMQTYTGRMFYPLDPRVDEIDINDIAHALSNLCRFGGHCNKFYSVAEHSVHCSRFIEEAYALDALLHDATEAYLVDVPRPIKRFLSNYQEIESSLSDVIAQRFSPQGTDYLNFHGIEVKQIDNRMLMTEAKQLLSDHPAPWGVNEEPIDFDIPCWTPEVAKMKFLDRFTTLYHAKSLYV